MRLASPIALAGLLLAAPGARAQVTDFDLYRTATASVTAVDLNLPQDSDTFSLPAESAPILSNGGDVPFDLSAASGGASAFASGRIQYLVSGNAVSLTGTFHEQTDGTGTAVGRAEIDLVFKISWRATQRVPYRVSGYVQTSKTLAYLTDFLACQYGGTVLAGLPDLAVGGPTEFERTSEIFPGETGDVSCRLTHSIGSGDQGDFKWSVSVNFGTGEGPVTTTTLPLSRKACKKSCTRSLKACRATCVGTKKEKRDCRRSCQQRRKRCSAATGCVLPLS